MEFILNKTLQFLNSSLKKLLRSLADNYYVKYLTQEFVSKSLEILKQKDAYLYEYMDNFKRLSEENLPGKECFYRSVKDKTTGDNGEKLDGHISNEDYFMYKKIGMNLTRKIWVIIMIII